MYGRGGGDGMAKLMVVDARAFRPRTTGRPQSDPIAPQLPAGAFASAFGAGAGFGSALGMAAFFS